MHANQLLHEGQSDASALIGTRLRALDPVEPVKQAGQFGRRDSDAGIRHRELGVVAAPGERDPDAS